MSTILAALQKQKSSPGDHFVQQPGSEKKLFKWRMALLTSLLMIIGLLTALLYLQLTGEEKGIKIQPSIASGVMEVAPPLVNEKAVKITKTAPKAVKKMTFTTQPLPEVEQQEIQLVPDQSTAGAAGLKSELDYSAVSNDLQQRFELALVDSTIQEQSSAIELSSDGRDLHKMATQFQQKVPSIRYDTHIYSTIAQDRWIKINGKKLREGQFDSQGEIQLLEIQPNRSIFRLGRQSFSLESLTDWKNNR